MKQESPTTATASDVMNAKSTAFEAIERNFQEIAKIGDSIFYFAELGCTGSNPAR